MQVRNLTEELAAVEAENGRLTEVITAEQPHNEELLLHVKELQHVRPWLALVLLLRSCFCCCCVAVS